FDPLVGNPAARRVKVLLPGNALWVEGWTHYWHVVRVRSAARALSGISAGAQLIVAGARARGPVAGGLLGSTGYWLLAHAACPVAVAR
ncbi:universal stress protein, partial [Amycolatopsis sp. NPDC000746]|uniref:universal stress protein n=1 Tax=Amycolatopsis sp. NPDC000746 TaxID=3154270 RepID=UPI003333935C